MGTGIDERWDPKRDKTTPERAVSRCVPHPKSIVIRVLRGRIQSMLKIT